MFRLVEVLAFTSMLRQRCRGAAHTQESSIRLIQPPVATDVKVSPDYEWRAFSAPGAASIEVRLGQSFSAARPFISDVTRIINVVVFAPSFGWLPAIIKLDSSLGERHAATLGRTVVGLLFDS